MEKYKKIDFWISLTLMILFVNMLIICLIENSSPLNTFLAFYLYVGFWHVLSMIIHTWKGWFIDKWGARRFYHIISLVLLITLPYSAQIAIHASPFMAIFYTILCYRETYIKMKRPLDDLK